MDKYAYEASVRRVLEKRAWFDFKWSDFNPVNSWNYWTGRGGSEGVTVKGDIDRAYNKAKKNPTVQRFADQYFKSNPIEYMRKNNLTGTYRNEAINAIMNYANGGEYKLSPGASVYMMSLAEGQDPLFSSELQSKLKSHAGAFKSRKDIKAYYERMAGLEGVLPKAIEANAEHLAGIGLTDQSTRNRYTQGLKRNLTTMMTPAVSGSLSGAFSGKYKDDLYKEYHGADYQKDVMDTTINGISNFAANKDHGLTPYQVAQHAVMYHNNPEYKAAFDKRVQGVFSGMVTKNTTPAQLRELEKRMGTFNTGIDKDFMKNLTPEQQIQLLASSKGNANPNMDEITKANMQGLTNSATNGIKSGIWSSGALWNDPINNLRNWAVYAHEKGMLPSWAGNIVNNPTMFWGTLATGGALAVGGIAMLVKSFLGSRDKQQQQQQQPMMQAPPGYQLVPTTTSFWRT